MYLHHIVKYHHNEETCDYGIESQPTDDQIIVESYYINRDFTYLWCGQGQFDVVRTFLREMSLGYKQVFPDEEGIRLNDFAIAQKYRRVKEAIEQGRIDFPNLYRW